MTSADVLERFEETSSLDGLIRRFERQAVRMRYASEEEDDGLASLARIIIDEASGWDGPPRKDFGRDTSIKADAGATAAMRLLTRAHALKERLRKEVEGASHGHNQGLPKTYRVLWNALLAYFVSFDAPGSALQEEIAKEFLSTANLNGSEKDQLEDAFRKGLKELHYDIPRVLIFLEPLKQGKSSEIVAQSALRAVARMAKLPELQFIGACLKGLDGNYESRLQNVGPQCIKYIAGMAAADRVADMLRAAYNNPVPPLTLTQTATARMNYPTAKCCGVTVESPTLLRMSFVAPVATGYFEAAKKQVQDWLPVATESLKEWRSAQIRKNSSFPHLTITIELKLVPWVYNWEREELETVLETLTMETT